MKYTKVRNDFIERRDLTAVERLILIYLYGRKRGDGQPWEVNREQVWTALNLGHDVTKKALSSLKAKGYLTDNGPAVRGGDGRIRRRKSTVIESQRGEIVALDTVGGIPPSVSRLDRVSPGRTEVGHPTVGNPPSNEELSNVTTSAGRYRPTVTASDSGREPTSAVTNGVSHSSSDGSERATASERRGFTAEVDKYRCPYCDQVADPDHSCDYLLRRECHSFGNCASGYHSSSDGCKLRSVSVTAAWADEPAF